MFLFLISIVILILFYRICIKPNQYWKNLNVPYLKPWPIFGNFAPFIFRRQDHSEWTQSIYDFSKGRYIGVYAFFRPILMITDLDLIKQIGIIDFDHFCDRSTNITEDEDPLFGRTLFGLRGPKWKKMRSTLSPAFTASKMRLMFTLITECCEQFNNHFLKLLKPNESITIEMKETFGRVANDVIATIAFGLKCDSFHELNNEFYTITKDATDLNGLRALKFLGYHISKKLMNAFGIKIFSDEICNFYRNTVINNMKIRERDGIVRSDMIHLLMEARKGQLRHDKDHDNKVEGFAVVEESNIGRNQPETKFDFSDDDITAQVLNFLLAGFDTTSTALSFVSYELALNVDEQKKLQIEIDSVMKSCNGKLTYEALLDMKYLDMVISEALRKWPPFSVYDRLCVKNYTIEPKLPGELPVQIRKGDTIWIPNYCLQMDSKFFPEPHKFDPERFSSENKRNIIPFTYMPFGIGPRSCIGSRLALLEMKATFFYILSKFDFVIGEKSQVPLQLKKSEFTLTAEKGFWLNLQLRNDAVV